MLLEKQIYSFKNLDLLDIKLNFYNNYSLFKFPKKYYKVQNY